MIRPIRKGAEIVGRWRDQDWEENKQRNKGNRSSDRYQFRKDSKQLNDHRHDTQSKKGLLVEKKDKP